MRMMMKVALPNDGANQAIKDGSIGTLMTKFMEDAHPEAAYFATDGGERCAFIFLDLKEVSDMPVLAERFFHGLNARITLQPAMTMQELKAGLAKVKL
jgi:hypothetical protein